MASRTGGSLTASSPFASMAQELLDAGVADVEGSSQAPVEDEAVDILEEFDEAGVYEDDANLDPLSAMEKYCRSELPQQRLAYAAGMGAAVDSLQPHEVSGTIVSLLRELLGDVYADVRYTALQQVSPVAQKLRSVGMLYQSDIETLWDLVQKLLLDADVENQEAASGVLAELSHEVAKGNAVAASQKLVLAVQKLQRLPTELQAEGALASLRLIAEVVAPREGSPLTFSTIEEFCVGTYKSMTSSDASADVRQAVALLLPRFARHMPPAQRASLLPSWIKTLAADTHWNVRAEVPQLLVNLLSPKDDKQQQQQQQSSGAAADSGSSDGSDGSSRFMHVSGHSVISKLGRVRAGTSTAAAGSVADSWGMEDLRLLCDVADKLCKDTSLQVKVAALASLGQLLPLLPTSLATGQKPNLLAHFVSTAKPQAQLAGVRVPVSLCAPRLSGHLAAMRQRQRQQRRQQQRAAEAREQSYQHAVQNLVQEADAIVESELHKAVLDPDTANGSSESVPGSSDSAAAMTGSSSSSSDMAVPAAASAEVQAGGDATGEQQDVATDRWLLGTASDTPVGEDDSDSVPAAGVEEVSTGVSDVASAPSAGGAQQQQQQKAPAPAAGTAAAELPCACALHIGKVALHAGPDCWQQLQGAFLELAVAAVNGDCDVAAALLLAFPDLSAALGHQEAAIILVPVVLELLHTRLDALTPVLSVTLLDVVSALAPELRICLLQTLPTMALQIDPELAGDWRARLAVAHQLAAVAAMVSSAQTAYCLWPLLVTFLRDPVCAVRAAAASQAGPLLHCLPEVEQPAEQTDAQKAAAAAAALKSAQDEQQVGSSASNSSSSSSSSAPAGDAAAADASSSDAAEQAIAAVVATHAVSAPSSSHVSPAGSAQPEQGQHLLQQQHQQQQEASSGPGQRLRWMRRGLTSGLYQLQQQVDRVRESPGLQKVVNGMDQQLTWLQQHPQGKVLWDLGSKLVRGNADLQSGAGAEAQITVEDLRRQLTSVQFIESAQLDPCKFLATPAWHALAAELLPFGSSQSCNDRLVYVIAAGSILSASAQQQQQQQQQQGAGGIQQQQQRDRGGELYLQQVLRQLQQLSADPTPGVRCAVAAVVSKLVSQGTSLQDLVMGADSSTESVRTAGTGSTTVSSSRSPSTDPAGRITDGGSTEGGGCPAVQQYSASEAPGCSAGGFSSLTSSGILSAPSTALAVLQDCLQLLQRDPCVSVAAAARVGVGAMGGGGEDAGVAVAAAAEADAAMLASMTAGDADAGVETVGTAEAADLL